MLSQCCVTSDLYEHRPACISCSGGTQALVADSGEEDGHSGELRTRDPAFVGYREGENHKENRQDKIEIRF